MSEWSPRPPHPESPDVLAGEEEGKWGPAPGYTSVDKELVDLGVVRTPCKKPPKQPHIFAGSEEGELGGPPCHWESAGKPQASQRLQVS